MPFPLLLGALPSILGGVAGLIGAKKQPTQQTQTTNQTGSSSGYGTSVLDPTARARIMQGLADTRQQYESGSGVSPVFGQAQNAIGQGLTGQQNFGGYQARDVNPYADMAFQNASRATQNQLTSEFARSGRNLDARLPARSEQLQTLAAGIYAPAYEAEAQRQYGSQEQAANRGLSAYGQSLNASPYFSQTQQGLGLDQYLQRASGMVGFLPSEQYTSSNSTGSGAQTTPLYNSPLAGFAGGAMLGRSLFPTGIGGQQQAGGVLDSSGYRIPGT